MKKTIKAALISLVLTLSLTVGVLFAACASDPVVFTDAKTVMTTPVNYTLTLKTDNTFTLVATTEREIEEGGMIAQLLNAHSRTGTYTFENNEYTLSFAACSFTINFNGQNVPLNIEASTVKSEYDEATKTYTINYSCKGFDANVDLELTYTK